MATARRTRQVHESTIWAAALAAVVVHGTILGTVHALGVSWIGDGWIARSSSTPSAAGEVDVELAASCLGDAVLASSARAALCFAPWIAEVDRCVADAEMSLWMDLSSCQARQDPSTAIAMIERRTADRLTPIDPEQLLEDRTRDAPPPPPPPMTAMVQPSAPPPPPPPARPQQVIETVKPGEEQEPDNARFLSEFNTKVDKQKVARGARNEPMVARSRPEELTPKVQLEVEPAVQPHDPDRLAGTDAHAPAVPGRLSMRSPGARAADEADQEAKVRGSATGAARSGAADGYAPRKGDGAIDQDRRERPELARGEGGAGGGAPRAPNLRATEEVLERAAGGGSVDHLEGVEEGDETALSAKRWVYASFFNRLKRQVAQNWDPVTVWRHSDPTGVVYGSRTRVTEVRVSLSRKGALAAIVVTTPSGVAALDDEAVRAFRSSGPFPNPPEGLVQKDNLITFAFSFFFEIGAPRVSWRLPQAM